MPNSWLYRVLSRIMHVITQHTDVHTVTSIAAITIRAIKTNGILGFLNYQQIGKTVLKYMLWLKTLGNYTWHIL